MRVSKCCNGLAVQRSTSKVDDPELKPGDDPKVVSAKSSGLVAAREQCKAKAVERMRERALSVPDGYSLNRDQLNTR